MTTKKDLIESNIADLKLQFEDGDKIEVFGNPFHGGDLLSTHKTLSGAARAMVEYHYGSDCKCGGAVARLAKG